jgi:hypothetical protein
LTLPCYLTILPDRVILIEITLSVKVIYDILFRCLFERILFQTYFPLTLAIALKLYNKVITLIIQNRRRLFDIYEKQQSIRKQP